MKSKYVCRRCGVAVGSWASGWKHFANMHTLSCGKKPLPQAREDHEREERELVEAAKEALQNGEPAHQVINTRMFLSLIHI